MAGGQPTEISEADRAEILAAIAAGTPTAATNPALQLGLMPADEDREPL